MNRIKVLSLALLGFVCNGCLGIPATEKPLPTILDTHGNKKNRSVVIMLPGRGDRGDTFRKHGFEQAGQQQKTQADKDWCD